jgi:hypothetical protein
MRDEEISGQGLITPSPWTPVRHLGEGGTLRRERIERFSCAADRPQEKSSEKSRAAKQELSAVGARRGSEPGHAFRLIAVDDAHDRHFRAQVPVAILEDDSPVIPSHEVPLWRCGSRMPAAFGSPLRCRCGCAPSAPVNEPGDLSD